MSDDFLENLITNTIGRNLRPLLRALYCVLGGVIAGTAFIVGMWYDLKQATAAAQRDATAALKQVEAHIQPMLNNHETRVAVLESQRKN